MTESELESNLGTIAKNTAGFVGADLENILNEAALVAAQHDKKEITTAQIKAFCNRYGYSMKDIDSALKFFPSEMVEEIKEFNKIAKQDESNQ